MSALVLALALAGTVDVRLLDHFAPTHLEARGRAHAAIDATTGAITVDGARVSGWHGDAGHWTLVLADGVAREYDGALDVRNEAGRLAVTLHAPLEAYVARVVASESLPGTPRAALEALAIVARSYALRSGDRHPGGALCDLAHCQVMRGAGLTRDELASASDAAKATAGKVLRLADGTIADATFHADCGGRTADPAQVFGASGTGAASVDDPECPPTSWTARMTRSEFLAAVRPLFDASAGPFTPEELVLLRGRDGRVIQVIASASKEAVAGDAFVRALGAVKGFGHVPSARLELAFDGALVSVRGSGAGHGVGLCQHGAAVRARRGESATVILAHYFPGATVGSIR